ESLVLGLEDDLVLPGSRLGEQAISVRPRGGLARERERASQKQGNPEADETRDEGHKAHDEDVGHDGDPFRAACAGTLAFQVVWCGARPRFRVSDWRNGALRLSRWFTKFWCGQDSAGSSGAYGTRTG